MSEKHKAGGAKKRFLSPELQAMWHREHRGEAKDKSQEEKKALRQKHQETLAAMSESEITALRVQLQAKWDALPAEKKQKLEQKISERGAGGGKKRMKNKGGHGGGRD